MASLINRIKHPGWTMLVPLSLVFLGTFQGPLVRNLCLAAAALLSTWIFYGTELAKGSPEHSSEQRKRRTGAAFIIFILVAVGLSRAGDRIENWKMVHKTETPSNRSAPKQEPAAHTVSPTSNPAQLNTSTGTPNAESVPSAKTLKKQPKTETTPTPSPTAEQEEQTTKARAPQTALRTMTPEERQIITALIQEYQKEHPGPVQTPVSDLIGWINAQLQDQGRNFRIGVTQRPPAILDNVNINSFGSTQLSVNGTVTMKGGSVTGGKVGIENNGGQVNLDGTRVSDNEKNIVNNAEPRKKEPEVKPPQP